MAAHRDRLSPSRGPVTMFANRFETAAFWASVAGLVLVLVIMGVRLTTSGNAKLEARIAEQSRQIDELREELAATRARLDSLRAR